MPRVVGRTISGEELRRRIDDLKPGSYTVAAGWLGLTRSALEKAMAGKRTVGRQTEIILKHLQTTMTSTDAAIDKVPPRGKPRSTRSA
jgi:hypothetical protein